MKGSLCYIVYYFLLVIGLQAKNAPDFILRTNETGTFKLVDHTSKFTVLADVNDFAGVNLAIQNLLSDFEKVTGTKPDLSNSLKIFSKKLLTPYISNTMSILKPQDNFLFTF